MLQKTITILSVALTTVIAAAIVSSMVLTVIVALKESETYNWIDIQEYESLLIYTEEGDYRYDYVQIGMNNLKYEVKETSIAVQFTEYSLGFDKVTTRHHNEYNYYELIVWNESDIF